MSTPILTLACLGALDVSVDGQPLTAFATDKTRALLVYLALEPASPHSRQTLLGLLWPDLPQTAALNNLRLTIYRLRQTLDHASPGLADSLLQVTRHTLHLNTAALDVDVHRLDALLAAVASHAHVSLASCDACLAHLTEAVELYRGELLAGFGLGDAPSFEEWLLVRREMAQQTVLTALQRLADAYEQRGQPEQTLKYAQRQLALDPYREEAHRQVMRAWAVSGQRSAALAQYETCRRVLAEELGVEPAPETRALYERIRDGETTPTALNAPLAPHNLPTHLTPLVGRERDLADLDARLRQAEVRLLTLVGAGGMGKTRLALEVGRRRLDQYPDGVFFVSLAPLTSAAAIPSTIGVSLGLTFQGDPRQGVVRALRDKKMLLILDNFEQLLDGASLVVEILQNAPQVQVIVTSRARLQVRGEHVYAVNALEYGMDNEDDAGVLSPALQMLLQSGQQVNPDFVLDKTNLAAGLRICRLVQGMPLGLELAAAWVETLSLEEIAREIESSVDFLEYDWQDAPERQRSMRAVFDWSWRLLSDTERQVYRQLSVFRGGFTREAAQTVVGVSFRVLTSLLHKSLIHVRQGDGFMGRYEVHELLRQFAAEQLTASGERETVEARHASYYLHFVADRERRLARHDAKLASDEIYREIDNVRQAWAWAVQHNHIQLLAQSAFATRQFFHYSGLFAEGERAFGAAVDSLRQSQVQTTDSQHLLGRLLAAQAYFMVEQGQTAEGILLAQQAIATSQASNDPIGELEGYIGWGYALLYSGQSETAVSTFEHTHRLVETYRQAIQDNEVLHEVDYLALVGLGSLANRVSDYALATRYLTASLELCQRLDKRAGECRSLTSLGVVALTTGAFDAGRDYLQNALVLARRFGYTLFEGRAQLELGIAGIGLGDFRLALAALETAFVLFRRMSHHHFETYSWMWLGLAYTVLGVYPSAQQYLAHSRQLSESEGARFIQADTMTFMALHYHHLGENDKALDCAERVGQIAQELAAPLLQADAWLTRGWALEGLDRLPEAALAYEQAVLCYTGTSQPHLATEARAGLVRTALRQGNLAFALSQVETLIGVLTPGPFYSQYEALRVYLTCYQALAAVGDSRAATILASGYALLMAMAETIDDETLRRSFLDHVTTHRELQRLSMTVLPGSSPAPTA